MQLTRRQFIPSIFGGLGSLFLISKQVFGNLKKNNNNLCNRIGCEYHYKGFCLRWTGWKECQNSTILVGQYVAWMKSGLPKDQYRNFYSSIPGGCGEYKSGDEFDISPKPHQEITALESIDRVGYTVDDEQLYRQGISYDEIREKYSILCIREKQKALKFLIQYLDKEYC